MNVAGGIFFILFFQDLCGNFSKVATNYTNYHELNS